MDVDEHEGGRRRGYETVEARALGSALRTGQELQAERDGVELTRAEPLGAHLERRPELRDELPLRELRLQNVASNRS